MMKRGVKTLDSIPIDLFLEIFSRLPSKSIARFRCVSKLWGSMLHLPYFTEMFLTRSWARPRLLIILQGCSEYSVFSSPQLQNPYGKSSSSLVVVSADFHVKFSRDMWSTEFCGITSGLIYFSSMRISEKNGGDAVRHVIFNPRTKQNATLPKLTKDGVKRISVLGFDPIDKQFKRMCINGVLYYISKIFCRPHNEKFYVIVCFDVRSESFKFIEVEECIYYATLINYKGKLGGIRTEYDGDSNTLELCLWVLEDVEKHQWSKYVYILKDDEFVEVCFLNVAGVTTAGEIVLSMRCTSTTFYVFYFNPEKTLSNMLKSE
ncbi:hypothetical protein EUTSA_v10009572mg, partial [Eutrema salsugineum]